MEKAKIPFFRPSIGKEEISEVTKCLQSGWLTTGPNALAFESEFSELMGGASCLAVTSATAALHLGLEALGVGRDDEVILPTLTFTATAEVVRYMEGKPVLVDIDPSTLCLDLNEVERAITSRTKVIMPVHFAGRPCDMTSLRSLADKHGLKILDDAAHALPATHQGDLIGTKYSDVTAFSFYANKTITTGEGGMLVTNDKRIEQRSKVMRLHGIDRDVFNRFTDHKAKWIYDVIAPGYKYNMTDLAAAIGRVQLSKVHSFRNSRARHVDRYNEAFASLPAILPPQAMQGDTHSWHLYILQIHDDAPINRDQLIAGLQDAGIGCSVHYRPLHQMTYWSKHLGQNQLFPSAELYFNRCVSLPLFVDMTHEEQDYVIDVVSSLLT